MLTQIQEYLKSGISLIPVRDKVEAKNGREYLAKTPYWGWKKHQTEIIEPEELKSQLETHGTTSVAMICGAVSGNLEVIDIDVKNWEGINTRLFSDIKDLMPDVWEKLRIHKTPSGGNHILYRISDHKADGNRKLAFQADAKEAAIETRGEGGYVLSDCSKGYSALKGNPIPFLTWAERCSLFAICEGYNERVKVERVKIDKKDETYYDENPFEDYNKNDQGKVLEEYGWKVDRENNHFIWYTRPGKDSGVSASFNKEKDVYWIFTSSSILDPSRGYNAASILSKFECNGDNKKCYQYLVSKGFGKVKPGIEFKVANSLAKKNKPVPANFSEGAKLINESAKIEIKENHPFGVFIKYDQDEEKLSVSREALYYVAENLGFRYYKDRLVRIEGKIINYATERDFQDVLKSYIHEEEAEAYEELCNIHESFMQKNGKYSITRLKLLDESYLIKDTKDSSFKFYQNGYLSITAEAIIFNSYDGFEKLLFDYQIQNRNYTDKKGGKYVDFLQLATVDFEQTKKVLGYLSHEYKDETTGFIIVLTETCPDPKNGGGSGKNVFCDLLKLNTTYISKPGVQAKFDEKFFQTWNRQRIFGISDVPKAFDFAFLKEPSTGSFVWKKLFKDEEIVEVGEAPKFIVQTNFSYEISDGGLKRRVIPIEFTNFFTLAGGVNVHFDDCHFPKGWSDEDYSGYDNLIAESIQQWMIGGLKLKATELTETGWQKQWEQTYNKCTPFILDHFAEWVEKKEISIDDFKVQFDTYCTENSISMQFRPSTVKMNNAIEQYCLKHGYDFKKDYSKRFNGSVKKWKAIVLKGEELPEVADNTDDLPF